jgi:hypothetical protein
MTEGKETAAALLLVIGALLACKGSGETTSAVASAGVVQPPAPAASALPAPEPKRHVLATFKGDLLQECLEITPPLGREEAVEKVVAEAEKSGLTRIGQRCDSLGKTMLGRCTSNGGVTVRTMYVDAATKTAMAACLKSGGSWETNSAPEAEMERAQQELQRLQGH